MGTARSCSQASTITSTTISHSTFYIQQKAHYYKKHDSLPSKHTMSDQNQQSEQKGTPIPRPNKYLLTNPTTQTGFFGTAASGLGNTLGAATNTVGKGVGAVTDASGNVISTAGKGVGDTVTGLTQGVGDTTKGESTCDVV